MLVNIKTTTVYNIVYSCVHTLSHDYTTALTIYGYVCAHTPRKDFTIVYILSHDYTLSREYTLGDSQSEGSIDVT